MARPAGVRNHDFEQKRNALVEGLSQFAVTAELRRTSLRQFAKAVDVSEPTLRHYFKDRRGVVVAILEYMGTFGRSVRGDFAAPSDSITNAVKDYYKVATPGPQFEMYTRAHAVGLIEGIAEDTAGKAYLKYMLEPALTANTEKLTATPGSPKSALELRAAAFAIRSPLIFMGIHQTLLGGAEEAPIDSQATIGLLQTWLGEAFSD
ncbi:MAG: AcrR family transcriptional regulator [Hyphomonas sp.]